MKRSFRIFTALVVIAVVTPLAVIAHEPSEAATSTANDANPSPQKSSQDARARRRLTFIDVFFLTPDRGFVAGSDGALFSTSDGGKNWVRQKIGDEDLRQIVFQDRTRGWMLAETGMLRTDDSGDTWRPWTPPDPRALGRIYFFNPQVGWLLGENGFIFKTSDGGESWRRQSSGVKATLNEIACFNVSSCIVAGDSNTLLSTSNGGQTWINRSAKMESYFNIHAVKVTPTGTAWALAVTYKTGRLLQSNNQGRTWEIAGRLWDDNPRSIYFFDARRGALLDAIAILYTEDGGATWKDSWPGGPLLNSFFFFNDRLAWAVGDFETILHTSDGGKTWVKQHDNGIIPIPHQR